MTYPEFREQEEEIREAAYARFQLHCDDEHLFKFFWFGVEARAVGRAEGDCPFRSGKTRGAFLAGMEWYSNHNEGQDYISPEGIAGFASQAENDGTDAA